MKKTFLNSYIETVETSISNINAIRDDLELLSRKVAKKINEKGRIIFVGAGLSAETAKIIIDELWFNFKINRNKFIALTAAKNYISDIEKWKELEEISSTSIFELDELDLNINDLVIGLSSSGKTQYVVSALKYAKDLGCETATITDASKSLITNYADIVINTNLSKSSFFGLNAAEGGTLQKIILDLIIYRSMEMVGRVYNDYLVFMQPVSNKLENYCIKTISEILQKDMDISRKIFKENKSSLEISLLVNMLDINITKAKELLKSNNNNFIKIINGIYK